SLSSGSINIGAAGGPGSVNVNASTGCAWTTVSPDSFVMITGGSSGSGSGAVSFQVLANPSSAARTSTLTIAGLSFVISQAGVNNSPATGLTFVAMTPCRVLETRTAYNFEGRTGAFGPPSLNSGETRTLPMYSSTVCPVPSTAKAYVVNVTL